MQKRKTSILRIQKYETKGGGKTIPSTCREPPPVDERLAGPPNNRHVRLLRSGVSEGLVQHLHTASQESTYRIQSRKHSPTEHNETKRNEMERNGTERKKTYKTKISRTRNKRSTGLVVD